MEEELQRLGQENMELHKVRRLISFNSNLSLQGTSFKRSSNKLTI